MIWWQIALLLLGALALAILGGVYLGRFFSRLKQRHLYKETKSDRQLNEYIESYKVNNKASIPSLEEAWQTKLQLKSSNNSAGLDPKQNTPDSITISSKDFRKTPINIPTTIPSANRPDSINQSVKERAERAIKGIETLSKIETATRINQANNEGNAEIERKFREMPPLETKPQNKASSNTTNITQSESQLKSISQKACLDEIRTNLKIATTPWTGKPLQFITVTMDNNPQEFDNLNIQNNADLREAYTDMIMANNIVWLVTELGTNSKELEDSYIKLCAKITERLQKILLSIT